MSRQTTHLYLRINRNRIHFLKFILEAYDGLAVLSVIEPKEGLILIRFAPECGREITELLSSLAVERTLH
jgi:hypothetical protein